MTIIAQLDDVDVRDAIEEYIRANQQTTNMHLTKLVIEQNQAGTVFKALATFERSAPAQISTLTAYDIPI